MKKIIILFFLIVSNSIFSQQDCATTLSICGNSSINYSPIGYGNLNETIGGCFTGNGENNSVWYKFQVATTGTLTFVITPTAPVDYDWAIFGPNKDCSNKGTPIRCNAAGTLGTTGLNLVNTNISSAPGPTSPFCKYMDVIAGETYYLFINNFVSSGFSGIAPFSLTWGGTATLTDPFLNSTIAPNPFVAPGIPGATTSAPREILICSNTFSFNFNSLSTGILNNNQNFSVSYHTSPNDALTGKNALTSPTNINTTTTYYYSIGYQDPNGGTVSCRQIGLFKFVDKSISLNISASSLNLCPGETSILTSNQTNGNQWSNGATTQSIIVNSGGTYTLNNTNGTCSSTESVSITSSSDPNLQIAGNLNFCEGASTTLTATTTGSGFTYLWSNGATTPTITITSAGVYTVTVKNSNNCAFTNTATVTKNALTPLQNATLNICTANSTAIFDLTSAQSQISSVSGVSFKFYQNQADALVANANNIANPSSFSSGNTTIYTVVQLGECSKLATITLTVTMTPTIVTQPIDTLVCSGNNTSLSINTVNDIGYQWQVNTGSGFIDLTNNITYSGVTTNTLNITNATKSLNGNTYKVIVKSNCTPNLESTIVTLTVPEITTQITTTHVSCFGQSDGSISLVASGGTMPYTYLWSNNSTTSTINQLAPGIYTVKITDANGCFKNETITITQPTALLNTFNIKNNTCKGSNNGSIDVITSGGTAPYTYLWTHNNITSSSIIGLTAGTYFVNVKDANNCIKLEQITVTEPNTLVATIISKNVNCNGAYTGEATAKITGGTAPHTYLWNNGSTTETLNQLRPNTYSVLITDANGCTANTSVVITEPSELKISTKQTKAGCNGAITNSITATASGGTAPYTYTWSNGMTTAKVDNLQPGTYNITITDANNCKVNEIVKVVVTADLLLTFNKKDITCNGLTNGSATAVVSGGKEPFSYQWSTGQTTASINGLTTGIYNLIVTDDYGCIVTGSVTVTQPSVLTATHQQTNVNCYGTSDGNISIFTSGGTPPYTYQWSTGAKTSSISQIPAGIYTVVITDLNNCTLTKNITISQPIDIATPHTTNQSFCISTKAIVNDLVVSGTNVKWYRSSVGGVPLNANDLLVNGDYFASQTLNGCESFARTEIDVTIIDTAIPSGYSIQEFCEPFVPKIADLKVTGTNIKWYDSSIGGNLLTNTNTLFNGFTYYASQTLNGCESVLRFAIKVNIYPNNPISSANITICDIATIQDISIEGYTSSQLKWYSNATSTQELSKTQTLASGTYYVSTYNYNLCESVRKAIQVTVANKVSVPVVNTLQTFCESAVVSNLIVTASTGAIVKWYNSAQATLPLASTTPLLSGTYYVEQEITPCKSPRIAVAVRVVSTIAPIMNNFVLCNGATVADLYLKASTNLKYVWFLNNTTTITLADTYTLTTGDYYVATDTNGCISKRTKVHVTVNARPLAPTGLNVQNFSHNAKVSDLVMNETNIIWFLSYSDAINRMNVLDPSTLLINNTTYYAVIIDVNGCPSYPTAVNVEVNLGTNNLNLEYLKYYPNPIDSEFTINYVEPIENVEIYSITGQRVFKQTFKSTSAIINFSRFSSGTYMVKVYTLTASQFIKVIKK